MREKAQVAYMTVIGTSAHRTSSGFPGNYPSCCPEFVYLVVLFFLLLSPVGSRNFNCMARDPGLPHEPVQKYQQNLV